MTSTKIVETRTVTRDYGFTGNEIIIDTDNGRLLIQDGFGGIDSLRGGAVRWEHGMVHQLKDAGTFATLDEVVNDYGSTLQDCMTYGVDQDRPQLLWHGTAIDKLASYLNL